MPKKWPWLPESEVVLDPQGDPTWFRSEVPPQPRHPRLDTLLRTQAARIRTRRKRAARRLLAEHGYHGVI